MSKETKMAVKAVKIGDSREFPIDTKNDLSSLEKINSNKWFSYKCIQCGVNTVKQFAPKNKEVYKRWLCVTCERKSRSQSSIYSKDNPKIIQSELDFEGLKYGSWIKYKCKNPRNNPNCHGYMLINFRPYRLDRYKTFLCESCKSDEYSYEHYGTKRPQQSDDLRAYNSEYMKQHPEITIKSLEKQRENNGGFLYLQTEKGREEQSQRAKDNPQWQQASIESNKRNRGGLHNMQTPEGLSKQQESDRNSHEGLLHTQTDTFKTYMQRLFEDDPEKCYFNTTEWKILRDQHWLEWRPDKYFFSTEKFKKEYDVHGHEWAKIGGYDGSTRRGGLNVYNRDNIKFDSKWEFEYYIFAIDHGWDVVREPIPIKYIFRGEEHYYHPDFLVNGRLVEIKGEHFFRPDGTMFMPFRNKEWTDEDYKYQCDLYEAKHQCMLEHGVQILRRNNMREIEEYIESIYGKDFCDKFKVIKPIYEESLFIPFSFNILNMYSFTQFTELIFNFKGATPFDCVSNTMYADFQPEQITPFGIIKIKKDNS